MTISVTSPDSNNKKIKINKELLMRLAPLFSLIILVGSDSNLLIVFYVQIMPDDLVMQLHRF